MTASSVLFLTDHQIGYDRETREPVAAGVSSRLRVLLPAKGLANRGYKVAVKSLRDGRDADIQNYDIYVVSKIFYPKSVEAIKTLHRRGALIISDHCDNYLQGGEYQRFQLETIQHSDRLICNTWEMYKAIKTHTRNLPVDIIDEPHEIDLSPIRFEGIVNGNPLRVLCFGNRQLVWHLLEAAPGIIKTSKFRDLQFELVTLIDSEVELLANRFRQITPDNVNLILTRWTEHEMTSAFARSDMVFIPAVHQKFNQTKSPNRLVEAVAAGLPVVAFPIPSYRFLQDFIPLTDDFLVGYRYLTSHRDLAALNLRRAQELVSKRHSQARVTAQWSDSIARAISGRQALVDRKYLSEAQHAHKHGFNSIVVDLDQPQLIGKSISSFLLTELRDGLAENITIDLNVDLNSEVKQLARPCIMRSVSYNDAVIEQLNRNPIEITGFKLSVTELCARLGIAGKLFEKIDFLRRNVMIDNQSLSEALTARYAILGKQQIVLPGYLGKLIASTLEDVLRSAQPTDRQSIFVTWLLMSGILLREWGSLEKLIINERIQKGG